MVLVLGLFVVASFTKNQHTAAKLWAAIGIVVILIGVYLTIWSSINLFFLFIILGIICIWAGWAFINSKRWIAKEKRTKPSTQTTAETGASQDAAGYTPRRKHIPNNRAGTMWVAGWIAVLIGFIGIVISAMFYMVALSRMESGIGHGIVSFIAGAISIPILIVGFIMVAAAKSKR